MQGRYHKTRFWYHLKKKQKKQQRQACCYNRSWSLICSRYKDIVFTLSLEFSPAMLKSACSPDEHWRFTVYTGTVSGKPLEIRDECTIFIIIINLQISMNSHCVSLYLMNCAIRAITAPAPGCNTLPRRQKSTYYTRLGVIICSKL